MIPRQISSKKVYQNPWLSVREDVIRFPDGRNGVYGVVERPPTNFIIALTVQNAVLFIKEYRYPVRKNILQLPSGTTDKGMTDLAAAKKELLEETGYAAKKWKKIGRFYIAPGHESIYANIFLAIDLNKVKDKIGCNDESIIKVEEIPLEKIPEIVSKSKIECGITLAALQLYFSLRAG